jgi:hypothetical protein
MRNLTTSIKFLFLCVIGLAQSWGALAQVPAAFEILSLDSVAKKKTQDSAALRIMNFIPNFSLHVDSSLSYPLQINRDPAEYFWYLKNSPPGMKISSRGLLSFVADKSYFLSGKLKYDKNYQVTVGVQNLFNPQERMDTTFSVAFFTTEIIPSRLRPSVNNTLYVEEGDTVSFKLECVDGSFPIETISFFSSVPIKDYRMPTRCGEDFTWSPSYDFIKDDDLSKQRLVVLSFVGANKFFSKDTANINVYVKNTLNYPLMLAEYNRTIKTMNKYILELKYAFVQLDQKVKQNKNTRTGFDLTSATTALGGTVLSTVASAGAKTAGAILPSAGVALVPVKEAAVPQKTAEQNAASLVRSSIKRLGYLESENTLVGDRDMEIVTKTNKLKEELRQTEIQLIDVPIDENNTMTEQQLDDYLNSKKVNKKYRLKS